MKEIYLAKEIWLMGMSTDSQAKFKRVTWSKVSTLCIILWGEIAKEKEGSVYLYVSYGYVECELTHWKQSNSTCDATSAIFLLVNYWYCCSRKIGFEHLEFFYYLTISLLSKASGKTFPCDFCTAMAWMDFLNVCCGHAPFISTWKGRKRKVREIDGPNHQAKLHSIKTLFFRAWDADLDKVPG
jgi:hypothetical protein